MARMRFPSLFFSPPMGFVSWIISPGFSCGLIIPPVQVWEIKPSPGLPKLMSTCPSSLGLRGSLTMHQQEEGRDFHARTPSACRQWSCWVPRTEHCSYMLCSSSPSLTVNPKPPAKLSTPVLSPPLHRWLSSSCTAQTFLVEREALLQHWKCDISSLLLFFHSFARAFNKHVWGPVCARH